MTETHRARCAFNCLCAGVFFWRFINHLENTFRSRRHAGHRAVQTREVADSGHHQKHGRQVSREFTHGKLAALSLRQSEHHHDRNTDHGDQLRQRRAQRLHRRHANGVVFEFFVDHGKTLFLVFVTIVDLHDTLTFVGFLKRNTHFTQSVLRAQSQALDGLTHPLEHHRQKRCHNQCHQRQKPVVINQDAGKRDDLKRVTHKRGENFSGHAKGARSFVHKLGNDAA